MERNPLLKMLASCALALLAVAPAIHAQDLEPRAYSVSPIGTNFVVLGYGHSSGSIVFDASAPISDVDAQISLGLLGAGRTFDLFGRQALVTALLPYSWGDVSGTVGEQRREVSRS